MKTFQTKDSRANIWMGTVSVVFGLLIMGVIFLEGYPLWAGTAPGRGLFPLIAAVGVILCGLSIMATAVFAARRERDQDGDPKVFSIKPKEIYNLSVFTGIAVLVYLLTKYLGLIPCVTLGTIFYAKLLSDEKWGKCVLIGLGTGVVIYLIFVAFLKVNFPKGIFGI